MFEKRLNKALKQDFKSEKEIVDYFRKEASKNYSDSKTHDLQCICEYLLFRFKNGGINISFSEYQELQFKEMWGV